MSSGQRVEFFLKNPNPLIIKYIEEWIQEAESKGLKSQYSLKTALKSIRKFPLPLTSGRDCAILQGFGPMLCNLIDKKLLQEHKKKIADEVMNVEKNAEQKKKPNSNSINIVKKSTQESKKRKIKPNDEEIIMDGGSFEIILLVDTQETSGKFKKNLDTVRLCLDSHKIGYEVRRLNSGDFCWICRDSENRELLLPFVVERKRLDDFASSIRDGRFHEQKHRLRESGVHNLIYLIEKHKSNQSVILPITTIMQAATNTQIHNNFQIKFTDSHSESVLYLAVFTKTLIKLFKNKVLISTTKEHLKTPDLNENRIGLMNFNEFQSISVKNKTAVREVFIKQLLQLKSLSVDRALAISNIYPTPKSLISEYKRCQNEKCCEDLLHKIPCGELKRPLGTSISKILYKFYNTTDWS